MENKKYLIKFSGEGFKSREMIAYSVSEVLNIIKNLKYQWVDDMDILILSLLGKGSEFILKYPAYYWEISVYRVS